MAKLRKNNSNSNSLAIRDALFGDMPISAWNGNKSSDEPWSSFQEAEKYMAANNIKAATKILKKIIETPHLESRHYVQAWYFLKSLGVNPPDDEAKKVYGVIVEVTLKHGVDIVACYTDLTARYFNYSGAAVIWDNPDDSLKAEIGNLLDAGRNIIHSIGPWEKERPGVPPRGQARVSMLTPSGLHFGQAPLNTLSHDEMGGPIIKAATNLMQALIKRTGEIS